MCVFVFVCVCVCFRVIMSTLLLAVLLLLLGGILSIVAVWHPYSSMSVSS